MEIKTNYQPGDRVEYIGLGNQSTPHGAQGTVIVPPRRHDPEYVTVKFDGMIMNASVRLINVRVIA